MNKNEMLELVEREVANRQPAGFRLSVSREGVRHEGRWWYVVVQPDRPDIRLTDYRDILSSVENAVEDQTDENLLLVPALSD